MLLFFDSNHWYLKGNSLQKIIITHLCLLRICARIIFPKELLENWYKKNTIMNVERRLSIYIRVYKLPGFNSTDDEVTICSRWQCSWRRHGRLPMTGSVSKRFRYQAGFTCCKLNDQSLRNSPSLASSYKISKLSVGDTKGTPMRNPAAGNVQTCAKSFAYLVKEKISSSYRSWTEILERAARVNVHNIYFKSGKLCISFFVQIKDFPPVLVPITEHDSLVSLLPRHAPRISRHRGTFGSIELLRCAFTRVVRAANICVYMHNIRISRRCVAWGCCEIENWPIHFS